MVESLADLGGDSANDSTAALCRQSFKAYSEANFSTARESLELLKKEQESVIAAASSSRDPMQLEEDKMTRIKQNILLCDYYQNKGQFPQKYLHELQKLASNAMSLNSEAAPRCQVSADGTQLIMGEWTNCTGAANGADQRKAGGVNPNQSIGQSKIAQNSTIQSAINSNMSQNQGSQQPKTNLSADEVFLNSLKPGSNPASAHSANAATANAPATSMNNSASQNSQAAQSTDQESQADTAATSQAAQGHQGSGSASQGVAGQQRDFAMNFNSVLLYNCAAMSFQTQQFGQCLAYLNMILKQIESVEGFLQVKALFLLLQTLYELRQCEPAQPIIFLLEVKLEYFKHIIRQKKQIRANSEQQAANGGAGDAIQDQDGAEESKQQWRVPCMESIEENIVSKNSYCILLGAYLRQYSVSPKNVNIQEYEMLLNAFKALFKLLQKDSKMAQKCFERANQNRTGMSQDPAQFEDRLRKPASQQSQGFLAHLGAKLALEQGKDYKAVQLLFQFDRDNEAQAAGATPQNSFHKSCYSTRRLDEQSRNDAMYQKCRQLHPQFYFNNLGILHLRLRKPRLAAFHFSKALKFLEVAQNVTVQVPQAATTTTSGSAATSAKENQIQVVGDGYTQPFTQAQGQGGGSRSGAAEAADSVDAPPPHEYLSSLNSQRASEILYNFGLALYKDKKYLQAFRNFEKASSALRGNPKLWYYLGLSVLHLNKQVEQAMNNKQQLGTFSKAYGTQSHDFEKLSNSNHLNRFQLAPQGDNLQRLQTNIAEQESDYLAKLQKSQADIIKNMKQSNENISKAKIKRQEKLVQTAWQQANMPKGSMQLDNAIMYLQNVLVTIQSEISNEQRYTLLYKFVAKAHIHNMQSWYNEAIAKSNDGSDNMDSSATEESKSGNAKNQGSSNQASAAEAPNGKQFGEDGFKYQNLSFPATQDDLNDYNREVREQIEKKYETLTKNVHFYLCYLFLETGDFRNATKHGEIVLKNYDGRLLKKTQFTVMQYLAEAYCMLEEHEKALQTLTDAQAVMDEGRPRAEDDTKLTVEMLTDKLVSGEKLSTRTIVQMNKAAIMLCQGDLIAARDQLNELLDDQNLRVVQTEVSGEALIPDYLIKTLVYFLIATQNNKMARHLTKYRRFVVDTGHQEQSPSGAQASSSQLSGPGAPGNLAGGAPGQFSSVGGQADQLGSAGAQSSQSAKKSQRKGNKSYISAIKSFS